MIPLRKTEKLIRQFERTHGIPLRLRKPRFWANPDNAYYDVATRQLMLPRTARGHVLKEFTFHEIGHALIHQYVVPQTLLNRFVKLSPRLKREKALELMEEDYAAPAGWVSWYAMLNGTEDFCEVLGAYVANDYRRTGDWQFCGFHFDVGRDAKLQRKLDWVEEILHACVAQAA
jgi:hypothetical protein